MCIAFGLGAASGAIVTELTRAYSLTIPVMLLMLVLLHCELQAGNWPRSFARA